MGLHPAIVELARLMPPADRQWPLDKRVTYLIALDAALALIYGGETNMIWIGTDGQIHISDRSSCSADRRSGMNEAKP